MRPTSGLAGALAAVVVTIAATSSAQAQKQQPPVAQPPRAVAFPVPVERVLPNGLRLLVVAKHDLPLADVSLYIKSGTASDPAGKEGLGEMVAELVTKGTKTRSAKELASQAETAGGDLSAGAGEDWTTVSSSILAEKLPLAFELVSDVARNATFPADQVEIARKRFLSQLQLQLSQPQSVAQRVYSSLVYGPQSPYGTSETTASLQGITESDLKAFYGDKFRAGNALLVVSGDVTPAKAEELAKKYFGDWAAGAPAPVTLPAPPARAQTQIFLVHRPGSVQSNILVGTTTMTPATPDYRPLSVGTHILGGGTDSRLFAILREQKSWTYGAYANLSRPKLLGNFVANTEVRTAVTDSAVAEMLKQIRRLQSEPVPAADLTAAKGFLAGSFPLRIQTAGQIGRQVAQLRLLGLPLTEATQYPQNINAVTAPAIQAAMKKYLDPQRLTIVVVGDAPKLKDGLEKIAPVTLLDIEGKPLDAASLTAQAPALKLDGSLLKPVTLTYAFNVQGNKMGDVTTTLAKEGDQWVARQDLASAMMNQKGELRVGAADLASISASQTMSAGGASYNSELKLAGGKVTGSAALPPQAGGNKSFDTAVPAGTLLPGVSELALMVLPLEAGRTITLPSFSVTSGAVSNDQFKITGLENVTVPAGTIEAYRIEVGGEQPHTLWVRKELPHIMVKQEMMGMPLTVELTAVK